MTPKQRRQQDILIRKSKEITKRVKDFKGSPSEREKEIIESQLPGSSVSEGTVNLPDGQSFLLEGAQGAAGEAIERKKGGMTKGQKKVGKVMSEFKAGKLKSSSGKKVTNPKQAIAIGLSEAGMPKKKMGGGMMMQEPMSYKKGGGVRGGRAEMKGLRPAKLL